MATLGDEHFQHLCGPERTLPDEGVVSIVGPGTGLGVAALLRTSGGYEVIETEGGHVDFAPLDVLEDRILVELRRSFRRVSVERIASGRGPVERLRSARRDRGPVAQLPRREGAVGGRAGGQRQPRQCRARPRVHDLGSVAGDMALAQGAVAVVIAGGVGLRLADYLPNSGFQDRFIAKGQFERRMDEMPVKLITHPQPGLIGAAAAFAKEHG